MTEAWGIKKGKHPKCVRLVAYVSCMEKKLKGKNQNVGVLHLVADISKFTFIIAATEVMCGETKKATVFK